MINPSTLFTDDCPYVVIEGDCLAVLCEWETNSVAAVVGDGPYSDHCHNNMRGNRGQNVKGKKKIVKREPGFEPLTPEEITAHTAEFCRIATQWIALFSDDVTLPLWREGITKARGKYARTIPWCRWASPNFSGMLPPSGAEFVAIARPHRDAACPSSRKWLNGGRTHYKSKCLRAGSHEKTELAEWSPDPDHPGHRAQKPIAVMDEVLGDCCLERDIIVDPYAGVASTGVAAIRRGMHIILIEKGQANAEMCRQRMAREWARIQAATAAE